MGAKGPPWFRLPKDLSPETAWSKLGLESEAERRTMVRSKAKPRVPFGVG